MPRQKKFNFMPIRMTPLEDDPDQIPTLSIGKNGLITFSKIADQKWSLEKSTIDFRWDPTSRVLGFKKLQGYLAPERLRKKRKSTLRFLEKNKAGLITSGIGSILTNIGVKLDKTYRFDVEKYQDLMEDSVIYFVRLPKNVVSKVDGYMGRRRLSEQVETENVV